MMRFCCGSLLKEVTFVAGVAKEAAGIVGDGVGVAAAAAANGLVIVADDAESDEQSAR